jgi:rRNA maturation endonuclease Nob1
MDKGTRTRVAKGKIDEIIIWFIGSIMCEQKVKEEFHAINVCGSHIKRKTFFP